MTACVCGAHTYWFVPAHEIKRHRDRKLKCWLMFVHRLHANVGQRFYPVGQINIQHEFGDSSIAEIDDYLLACFIQAREFLSVRNHANIRYVHFTWIYSERFIIRANGTRVISIHYKSMRNIRVAIYAGARARRQYVIV